MGLNREQIDTQETVIPFEEFSPKEYGDYGGNVKWYTFENKEKGRRVHYSSHDMGFLMDSRISENEIMLGGLVFKLKYTCWRNCYDVELHIDNDSPKLPIRRYLWN